MGLCNVAKIIFNPGNIVFNMAILQIDIGIKRRQKLVIDFCIYFVVSFGSRAAIPLVIFFNVSQVLSPDDFSEMSSVVTIPGSTHDGISFRGFIT